MSLALIRYGGLGLMWVFLFYLSMEFWELHVPSVFAWLCVILMLVGAAVVGNFIIRMIMVAWLLACVAWGREP